MVVWSHFLAANRSSTSPENALAAAKGPGFRRGPFHFPNEDLRFNRPELNAAIAVLVRCRYLRTNGTRRSSPRALCGLFGPAAQVVDQAHFAARRSRQA